MTLIHGHQPGLDFLQRKWLDEIIVGTTIEPFKLIVQGVSRGKHQHGCIDIRFLTEFSAQCDAIHTRQTKIKQNAVEFLCYGKMQAGDSICSRIHAVPASLEEIVKVGGDRGIVFNNKYAHARIR
jgi:hypothetical protein